MAKHKLMDLDKATWEKLKKSHDMKKKGLLEAIFTKVTGINVGDHINTFRTAAEIFEKSRTGIVRPSASKQRKN